MGIGTVEINRYSTNDIFNHPIAFSTASPTGEKVSNPRETPAKK